MPTPCLAVVSQPPPPPSPPSHRWMDRKSCAQFGLRVEAAFRSARPLVRAGLAAMSLLLLLRPLPGRGLDARTDGHGRTNGWRAGNEAPQDSSQIMGSLDCAWVESCETERKERDRGRAE